MENRKVLSITILADAHEEDRAFTVNGKVVRVGIQYSLNFPEFYGVGYCVALNAMEE